MNKEKTTVYSNSTDHICCIIDFQICTFFYYSFVMINPVFCIHEVLYPQVNKCTLKKNIIIKITTHKI